MPPEFYLLAGVVLAFAINQLVRRDAPSRHARYRMRAKLAQLIYAGRLTPVSVRRVRRRGAAKRSKVLSVVRRDTQNTGTAE